MCPLQNAATRASLAKPENLKSKACKRMQSINKEDPGVMKDTVKMTYVHNACHGDHTCNCNTKTSSHWKLGLLLC